MNRPLIVSGYRIAVGGIIIHNEQIVLLRRPDKIESHPSIWEIPSGGVYVNETLKDAIIREVFEETKLNILVGQYVGYFTYISKNNIPCIQINHICSLDLSSNLQIKISDEHIYGEWVTISKLSKYKVSLDIQKLFQNVFLC